MASKEHCFKTSGRQLASGERRATQPQRRRVPAPIVAWARARARLARRRGERRRAAVTAAARAR
eukprot:788199-Prymnesium_polylepis.1